MNTQARLDALVRWYETLTPDSVAQVATHYAADAHFIDPFNDVRGVAAIGAIFEHMFRQVELPRFVVERAFVLDNEAMLRWRFEFVSQGQAKVVPGATALLFDAEGKVCSHRDYWDPAREIYAGLPLVGPLIRWLTRRLTAPMSRL
ncbi:nuclear transport factor 2 family protein [Viridibacterium curvum]|uniref:Nuclear transport factor 2 family protein n=1 Tax=Viridibacterium curvum TaxID=1101404 RepID=A0ABP9QVN5_9RHOO